MVPVPGPADVEQAIEKKKEIGYQYHHNAKRRKIRMNLRIP